MFVEIKLARMKNVKLVELLHNENKIVNTEIRTYRKHFENIVTDNENNENDNIET